MIDSYVGIDIAKAKFDVAVSIAKSPIRYKTFANNSEGFQNMISWLESDLFAYHPHFCMEATGRYGEMLSTFLHGHGFAVSVVNPSCIKNYARCKLRRTKTDKVDACLIAEYCLKESPLLWQPLPKQSRELQQMTRELEHLKGLLADEKSRAKSGTHTHVVTDSIQSRLSFFQAQIKLLEEQINSHVEQSKQLSRQRKLLLTIPGVGATTANALLAEIPDITKFKTAKQLVAFAGLVPREQTSGTLQTKTRMSKVGSSRLRKILYMPTVSAKRYNPVIIALCSRIEQTGKCKMIAIGAAMRKLVHIVFGVLKSGKSFNKRLHLLET